jgi:hypothetical protein
MNGVGGTVPNSVHLSQVPQLSLAWHRTGGWTEFGTVPNSVQRLWALSEAGSMMAG